MTVFLSREQQSQEAQLVETLHVIVSPTKAWRSSALPLPSAANDESPSVPLP